MKSSIKSSTGRISTTAALLMVIIISILILKQAGIVKAQNESVTGYYAINLDVNGNVVRATLRSDSGAVLENQQIDFYLNNTMLGSGLTNAEGFVDFTVSNEGILKVVFNSGSNSIENETLIGTKAISEPVSVTQGESENNSGAEQQEAEINKPVRWVMKFKGNAKALAPEKSFNVSVQNENIEYYTDAPSSYETVLSKYRKLVTVSSAIDYTNIKTYTSIEDTSSSSIRLFWLTDNKRIDVTNDPVINLTFVDTNNNGLIDRLEWTTPHTSNQTFEVSIIILNPYTYLRNGENWTVAFNTTGQADLIISSTNANWTEFLTDNPFTLDEMKFLDISCGEISLKDSLIVIDENGIYYNYSQILNFDSIRVKKLLIRNYTCSETGYIINNMPIAGYATLKFEFGNQIAYAYDVDWTETCTVTGSCSCATTGFCGSVRGTCISSGGYTCGGSCASRPNSTSTGCVHQGSNCDLNCPESNCISGGGGPCACTNSLCSYTCDTANNWTNDDGNNANGCENQPPYYYSNSTNNTNPSIGDAVKFSTNWTDIYGVGQNTGYGVNYTWFEWNATGAGCNVWANLTSVGRNNVYSVWHNETQTIPAACAGNVIGWRQYATDSAYRVNVTTTSTITVRSADVTNPTWNSNSTNGTLVGQIIEFRLNWSDNIGLNYSITSLWNGSAWVNYSVGGVQTWCDLTASSWCNQTMRVNNTVQQLWWKQYANDSSNNWNVTQNFSLITDANLTNCAVLNGASGTYYYLVQDITNSGFTICMNVTGSNITLDCQGKKIGGASISGTAVFSNSNNITVKNCNISTWSTGITAPNNNNITNITISNVDNGISSAAYNSSLDKINITYNNYGIGISIGGYNSNISNVNVSSVANGYGILISSSYSNTTLTNITANNNGEGIELTGGGVILNNITANYNVLDGIYIQSTSAGIINITNLTANYNQNGIKFLFYGASNTIIINSTLLNNSKFDIYFEYGASNCNLALTNVNGTENKPIVFYNSSANIQNWNNNASEIILCNADYSIIRNVTMRRADGYSKSNALFLFSTDYTNLTNINVSNLYHGIYLYGGTYNNLTSINSTGNSKDGLLLTGSSYNNLINITAKLNYENVFLDQNNNYNNLTNMTLADASYYNLYLNTGKNNTVSNSIIKNSSTGGIYMLSEGNLTFYNNLLNNSVNVNFYNNPYNNSWNTTNQTGTRIYSSGTKIGGNYWTNSTNNGYSDTCTDSNVDGFCDSALNITNMVACTPGVNCGPDVDYLPLTTTANTPPTLSYAWENPTDPATYVNGATYRFNVTVCDAQLVADISKVLFEWAGGANVSVTTYVAHNTTCRNYTTTKTDLAAQTATGYKWYANDTSNAWATALSGTYTVDKGTLSGTLTCSGTGCWGSVTYGTSVTIGYSESNSGDGDVTYKVYRDGVDKGSGETWTPGVGSYSYKLNTTAGTFQNWSSSSSLDTNTLTVNRKSPTLSLSATWTITYGSAAGVTGSESNTGDSDCTYTLYRNTTPYNLGSGSSVTDNTILAVGGYLYTYNNSQCTNYTSGTTSNTLTVNKGSTTATLYLNESTSSQTSVYPNSTVNATATSSVSGLYVQIWRNDTLISNVTSTSWNVSSWGAYNNNFSAQVLGNENYSSSALVTLWWNVSKGPTNISLYLNGTQNNNSYVQNNIANFTAVINVSGKTVYLDSNYTGWTLQSGTTPLMNYTTLSTIGDWYNLTGYFLGDENYSSSTRTYFFNVTTTTIVSFNVTLPDSSLTSSSEAGTPTADEEFNATVSTVVNVSPCIRGAAQCQTQLIANFIVNNTGNVNENITLCINASLSSKIAIWGTRTNNPYSNPTNITSCSSGSWIANSSLPVYATDQFWIWTNFTNVVYPDDSTNRTLYINATQSGT